MQVLRDGRKWKFPFDWQPLTSMHSTTTIPRGHNQMITMNWLSNQLISIVNPSIFRIISWTSSKMQTQQRTNENTFEWRNSRESWPCRWSYSYSTAWKNNARVRTSFCVRKKKFFLRLFAGHLSSSPGNRKNFFAVARQKRKNFFAVRCSNRKNFFAVLCGNTLKGTRQGTLKWKRKVKQKAQASPFLNYNCLK